MTSSTAILPQGLLSAADIRWRMSLLWTTAFLTLTSSLHTEPFHCGNKEFNSLVISQQALSDLLRIYSGFILFNMFIYILLCCLCGCRSAVCSRTTTSLTNPSAFIILFRSFCDLFVCFGLDYINFLSGTNNTSVNNDLQLNQDV